LKRSLLIFLGLAFVDRIDATPKKCEDFFASTVDTRELTVKARQALGPEELKRLKKLADFSGNSPFTPINVRHAPNISALLEKAYPRFSEDPKLLFSIIYNLPKKLHVSSWNQKVLKDGEYAFLRDVLVERPIKIPTDIFTEQESMQFLQLVLNDLANPQVFGILKTSPYDLWMHENADLYYKYFEAVLDPHLRNLDILARTEWMAKFEKSYLTTRASMAPFINNDHKLLFAKLRHKNSIPAETFIDLNTSEENVSILLRSSAPFLGAVEGKVGWELTYSHGDLKKLAKKPREFKINNNGHEHRYRLRVEETNKKNDWTKYNSDPGPNYKLMGADGVQRGLVIADTDFSKADLKDTLGEYLKYFREKGFKFKTVPIGNFIKYFQDQISNGGMDYVIREGHGDMTEFSLHRKGTLHVGSRPGNPSQEIIIFLPHEKTYDKAQLHDEFSWSHMGEWLNKRGDQNPLYFVDTKCQAADSICEVLPEVRNANLQIIAPINTATTFENSKTSPLRSLVEGLIERRPYAVINNKVNNARKKAQKEVDLELDPQFSPEQDEYIYPTSSFYRATLEKLKEEHHQHGTLILEIEDKNSVFQTIQSTEY